MAKPDAAEPEYTLDLLPALPRVWPEGSVKGLRARGGFTVDLEWETGRLGGVTIHSTGGRRCRVCYGPWVREVQIKPGRSITLDASLQVF